MQYLKTCPMTDVTLKDAWDPWNIPSNSWTSVLPFRVDICTNVWQIWNVQWEQNVGPNAHPRQRHGYYELSSNPICKMGALSVIIFRVTATAASPVTSIIPWISLADTQQRQWPHILLTLSHYNLELTFVGGNLRFDRTGFLPDYPASVNQKLAARARPWDDVVEFGVNRRPKLTPGSTNISAAQGFGAGDREGDLRGRRRGRRRWRARCWASPPPAKRAVGAWEGLDSWGYCGRH
jgi:hypothetical protein